MKLLKLLDDLERRAKIDILVPGDREAALKALGRMRSKYAELGTVDEDSGAYIGLCGRMETALSRLPLGKGELASTLSLAAASWYDISGRLGPYRRYVYAFFASAISFFVLAPQFFPPVLPILFVVPVFLAIRGLKRRNRTGYSLSMLVYPVSLLAASAAARSYIPALGDFSAFVAGQAEAFKASPGLAATISIFSLALTFLSFLASIYGSVTGLKHKDMFV